MKKLIIFALFLLIGIVMTACGCDHSWEGATCTAASVCKNCGETNGKALGHSWSDADCVNPQICSICDETKGEALGHNASEATCLEAAVCGVCGETVAEAKGHSFAAPTCTEAEICDACGEARGEALGHTWKDADCNHPKTCQTCGMTEGEHLAHNFTPASCTSAKKCTLCGLSEGSVAEHTYASNVCTGCGDKLIESYYELSSYLNENFSTLETKIGKVTGIGFNVFVNDPNYWSDYDFCIEIEPDLYCYELDNSLDYAIMQGDFLPYSDRIEALGQILDYQYEVIKVAEAAFPGMKFAVRFFEWGYYYPNIKVDYYDTEKIVWVNFQDNGSGATGYAGTSLCGWRYSFGFEFASGNKTELVNAIKAQRPQYTYVDWIYFDPRNIDYNS